MKLNQGYPKWTIIVDRFLFFSICTFSLHLDLLNWWHRGSCGDTRVGAFECWFKFFLHVYSDTRFKFKTETVGTFWKMIANRRNVQGPDNLPRQQAGDVGEGLEGPGPRGYPWDRQPQPHRDQGGRLGRSSRLEGKEHFHTLTYGLYFQRRKYYSYFNKL